jgi:TonB family protein
MGRALLIAGFASLVLQSPPDRFLDGVFRAGEVTIRPKVVARQFPAYVGRDLSGSEGILRIDFIVERNGTVRETRTAQESHPELLSETVAALKNWKLQPGVKDGQPVRCLATMVVDFKVRSRPARGAPRTALTADITVEGVDDALADAVDARSPGVVMPKVLKEAKPTYPRGGSAQGIVRVEAIVGVDGRIAEARILSSVDGRFDEAALAAARKWTFTPATKDGKRIPVRIVIELEFRRHW